MDDRSITSTDPIIIHCESGGWMALSRVSPTLPQIGVTGATANEARASFRESLARWVVNLNRSRSSHPP